MKRLQKVAALVCLIALPASAWNPFKGRTGYVISAIAVAAANACDYKTTRQDITSGAGSEGNPFLQQIVENRDHFIGVKIGAGALPIGLELLHLRHYPRYLAVYTLANWGIAGSVGIVAAHNRSIYLAANPGTSPLPLFRLTARHVIFDFPRFPR